MIESTVSPSRRRPRDLSFRVRGIAFVAGVLASASVFAQQAPREGINYTVVKPPQPTSAPAGKVEVIEFFGYWCPHCSEFEPTLKDWAKRNDAKVQMTYVPVPLMFRAGEAALQKFYYTLDALGKEKELRGRIFSSIHGDRSLPYDGDVNALATWAEKNGIDRKKFVETFDSFTVQSKVTRANQLASAYGVTGVPELGMGGKYLLTVDARSIATADLFLGRVLTEK